MYSLVTYFKVEVNANRTYIMQCKTNYRFFRPAWSMVFYFLLLMKTGMSCQMEENAVEIHTTGRIPCRHDVPPELISFVRWTKSIDENCFENGGPFLVSWNGDQTIWDQNYGLDTDFSLVIPDVTTMFIGIYRCCVRSTNTTVAPYTDSDNRLTVYKYPDEPPSITYEIRENDEIEITCTVGPVFPLFYPNFPMPYRNSISTRNEDGTYIVSIGTVQSFSGNEIILYCSHSYPGRAHPGQHQSSFLKVHRSHDKHNKPSTTSPQGDKTTQQSGNINTEITKENGGDAALTAVSLCLVIVLSFISAIVACIGGQRHRNRQRLKSHRAVVGHLQELMVKIDKGENDGNEEKDRLHGCPTGVDKKKDFESFAAVLQAMQEVNTRDREMKPSTTMDVSNTKD